MSLPSSVTSAPAGSILMEARDLHKRYSIGRRTLEVLRGVSVQVARGEFLALRGASGAGKSTLLHLLGGLDTPNQGTILSDGVNLASLSNLALSRWRNQKVGFIFQAYHLLPELDALENVCLPARLGRISVDTAVERGRELLRRVGLADRMDHKPFELSGGEQQRVAIARSLINSLSFSSPTNRRATSIRTPAKPSSSCSAACGTSTRPRSSSRPTTRKSRAARRAFSSSRTGSSAAARRRTDKLVADRNWLRYGHGCSANMRA